jgi:hypothetical protein
MASMSSETDLLVSACCGHTFALSRLQSVRFIEEQHFPLRALRTVAERANGVVRCSVCGEPSLVDSVCDSTSDKPVTYLTADAAPLMSIRQQEARAFTLATDGVLIVPSAISASAAARANAVAEAALDGVLAAPLRSGRRRRRFPQSPCLLGEVREPAFRFEILLELCSPMHSVLRELLADEQPIGSSLSQALGEDAALGM